MKPMVVSFCAAGVTLAALGLAVSRGHRHVPLPVYEKPISFFVEGRQGLKIGTLPTGVSSLSAAACTGCHEQEAAEFVASEMETPVVGFIAGQTAPPGRRMGHAGAIISGSEGTAREKIEAFERAGIGVARKPSDIVDLVREVL